MAAIKGAAIKGLAKELNLDSYGDLRMSRDIRQAVEYGITAPMRHKEMCKRQARAVNLARGGYDGTDQ